MQISLIRSKLTNPPSQNYIIPMPEQQNSHQRKTCFGIINSDSIYPILIVNIKETNRPTEGLPLLHSVSVSRDNFLIRQCSCHTKIENRKFTSE